MVLPTVLGCKHRRSPAGKWIGWRKYHVGMCWPKVTNWVSLLLLLASPSLAQAPCSVSSAEVLSPTISSPLPDPTKLLQEVERNQKKLEGLQRDYTYHVHTDQQELDKQGSLKKNETEEAESLTIDGVRVNRLIARNGKALTPEEQQKESERIDKEVTKAKERRSKIQSKGGESDERGEEIMPVSRILELGSFSNSRREWKSGRPVIVLDYAGNPQAKTHSTFEGIMRNVVGTVWIDETDRIVIAAEGHFFADFKLGAGLLADLRKGTSFDFRTTRVSDGVWLPADIRGQGTVRVLLFANFSGRLHVTTSDYRRFRTSATIVGSHGAIGSDGEPVPEPPSQQAPSQPQKAIPSSAPPR